MMSTTSFHPVIKTIFFFAVGIVGLASASVFEFYFRFNSDLGISSRYDGIVWIVCAFLLFLAMVFFFRLTRVSWLWSILGGVVTIAIYSTVMKFLFYLLDIFMQGWLWG
jgi:hypothetical protein